MVSRLSVTTYTNPLVLRIFRRCRQVKNPDTGKRVSRLNPVSEWIATDVPHLWIVPDELRQDLFEEFYDE
jgi:hypothetical protein